MNYNLEKTQRYAQTSGKKGWAWLIALLAIMCFDQFVLQIPFANVVFPILVICAASMTVQKNIALIICYSVLFELSCIAWFIWDLPRVPFWLLEVTIGYSMPLICYKLFNRKHKNIGIVGYALIAAFSEILYFWVSVIATCLIWKVPFVSYLLSDLPFEALGAVATFVCALPVAFIYKLLTGEIILKKRENALCPSCFAN